MMTHNELNAPWAIRFDRDGTEDIAVIYNASGEELLRSRPFWLPDGDDSASPTLAAMRLTKAAPNVLLALERAEFLMRRVVHGDHRAFEKLSDAAKQARKAVTEAKGGRS